MSWNPNTPGATSQQSNQGGSTTNLVVPSQARTATGQSGANLAPIVGDLGLLLDTTAVSGTTPSMTVSVEWSNDGTTWTVGDPADAFTAQTAAGRRAKAFAPKAQWYRVVWTISGTTPSFTFSVTARG